MVRGVMEILTDQKHPIENMSKEIDLVTCVTYNIVGRQEVYTGVVTVTILNAFNIVFFSMGEVDEKRCDDTITEESSNSLTYKRLFIRNNKIIGDNKYSTLLKNAIEKKIVFSYIDILNAGVNYLLVKLKNN